MHIKYTIIKQVNMKDNPLCTAVFKQHVELSSPYEFVEMPYVFSGNILDQHIALFL